MRLTFSQMIIMLLLMFFLGITYNAQANPPDSCFTFHYIIMPASTTLTEYESTPDSIVVTNNPDSIMIDTCINSPSYGKMFTKKNLSIKFKDNYYPFDNVIQENEVKTVNDLRLDYPEIQNQFQQIVDSVGPIYFIRHPVGYVNLTDSVYLIHPYIWAYFGNYQEIGRIDSLINEVDSVESITMPYNLNTNLCTIPTDNALKQNQKLVDIYSKLSVISGKFPNDFKPLGFQTEIYELNLPMAWEITFGVEECVIGIGDNYSAQFHNVPDEFLPKDVVDNLKYYFQENIPAPLGNTTEAMQNLMEWTQPKSLINHGLCASSCAIAAKENGAPMVGAAPKCKFINFPALYIKGNWTYINLASDIDCDSSIINNKISYPLIQSMSFGTADLNFKYDYDLDQVKTNNKWMDKDDLRIKCKTMMNDYGIILVAAAGNRRSKLTSSLEFGYDKDEMQKGNLSIYNLAPTKLFPAALSYFDETDPNNQNKDYKVIAVGGTKTGVLYNSKKEFVTDDDRDLDLLNDFGRMKYTRDIQFKENFNFSPGTEKFPSRPNGKSDEEWKTDRRDLEEYAFVDVVAPSTDIFLQHDDCPGIPPDPMYYRIESGTSFAAPMVSGIVGLMSSVNRFMGVTEQQNYYYPLINTNNPGCEVQRRAYNILTFTTKKIRDYDNFSQAYKNKRISAGGKIFGYTKTNYQYDYITQSNDKLKRSWAQRVGFGLVDAFRAVAHSIRNKGLYNYQTTGNLVFPDYDANSDSRGYKIYDKEQNQWNYLLHFGSKAWVRNSGNNWWEIPANRTAGIGSGEKNVLEWGGVSLPDDNFKHNNQGVTLLNSGSGGDIILTIPGTSSKSCILAIDGILLNNETTNNPTRKIVGTNNYSKILVCGYIKDVGIECNKIKIGDLIIDNEGTQNNIKFLTSTENYNEIYGTVKLQNKSKLLFTNGSKLYIKPGGSIEINGENDLVIDNNSTVVMDNSSSIVSKSTTKKKLIIAKNSILKIKSNCRAILDCKVDIYGELQLEDNAEIFAGNMTINRGAGVWGLQKSRIFVISGWKDFPPEMAHISFGGNVLFQGTEGGKVTISSTYFYGNDPFNGTNSINPNPPMIYFSNDNSDTFTDWMNISNVDFQGVIPVFSNVNFEGPIKHCTFNTNTDTTLSNQKYDHLLSFYYDKCNSSTFEAPRHLIIDSCVFADMGGPVVNPLYGNNPNKYEYNTGGIKVEGFQSVLVHSCTFSGLEFGVMTLDCDTVRINSNTFSDCGIGDIDQGSYTKLCSNTFSNVQFGSIRDHSLGGRVFDNEYNYTRVGFDITSGLDQRFRNNYFNQYYNAIRVTNSETYLRSKLNTDSGYYNLYGRNRFEFENPQPYVGDPDSYPNKFIRLRCDSNFTSDIFLYGSNWDVSICCGYNKFSQWAKYHFMHQIPGSTPTIDGGTNEFPGPTGIAPRTYDVTIGGAPWNLSTTANPSCDEQIATTQCSASASQMAYRDDDLPPITELKSSNDNEELTMEHAPLFYLKSSVATEKEKLNSSYQLYQNIVNCNSNKESIENLSIIFSDVLNSNRESDELNSTLLYLSGKIQYLLKDNKKAESSFRKIITKYPESNEYNASLIMLDKCNSNSGKSGDKILAGASYLLSMMRSATKSDCKEKLSDVEPEYDITKPILEQNMPNPFSKETSISFILPNTEFVSLKVFDSFGNLVLFPVNALKSKGRHTITISTENMISGIYYYQLKTLQTSITKSMVLIK